MEKMNDSALAYSERRDGRPWRLDPTRSVPKVIGDEVRVHGSCWISRPEIARRAGVGKTTTDQWLLTLVERRMIEITSNPPNRPSVIRIISPTWLALVGRA